MTKDEAVSQIRAARIGHKQWVSFAEALLEGIPLDQEKVPLTPAECQFGKWYYREGRGLADLPSFQKLEEPHDAIHQIYQRIFAILFEENQPSRLARFFGTAANQQAEQKEKARALMPHLKDYSDQIILLLDELEKEICAMDQAELARRME